jgi:pimeloyl-ACP methyl ester carboxylesterase
MGQAPFNRSAVVAPGGNYGPDGPLLMYARLAVERRGGRAHRIEWQLDPSGGADFSQLRAMVNAQVTSLVDEVTAATGTPPVIIGKSLGSLAAPLVADRGLAAVWFTPLLTDEATAAALRRATGPYLLVGGTADRLWDREVARSLGPEVIEIDGADHGMIVPGGLAASAAVLGKVITAVEAFIDQAVWPLGAKTAGGA